MKRSLVCINLTLALVVAACGSNRSAEEIAAASVLRIEQEVDVGGASAADGTGVVAGPSGGLGSVATDGDGPTSSRGGSDGSGSGPSGTGQAPGGEGSGTTSPSDAPQGAATGTGEIVVASIGNYSGIPGAVYGEAGLAVQAWAQSVTDAGGIGGRPVRALLLDDGGDPARHSQMVKDAVENKGVDVFIASFAPLTGASSVDYLKKAGVATVGGQGSDPWFATSPVHYPTIAAGDDYHYANTAATVANAKSENLSTFGVISCVEATSCQEAAPKWEQYARELGMNVTYNAQASIAQPDFTSECLNARDRGVEVFMIALDGNSARRLAAACARQGYRPKYMQPGEGFESVMLEDPNLDGIVTGSAVYPILVESATGASEIASRIRSYMGEVDNILLVGQAWHAAIVVEKALASVGGEITPAKVIEGLGTIKGDDFGGLGAPITYKAGAASHSVPICYFVVSISGGAFVTPDGAERHCE